jgi:cobalt/nickel transport system ATP-binding protein
MSPVPIELADVTVWRDGRQRQRRVVERVTLRIAAGERIALAGPNGAGKTSLLLALVGAIPFEGTIMIGEHTLDRASLAAVRSSLGFVFADPADQLFCASVEEEVAFGPRQRDLSPSQIAARVESALRAVDLAELKTRVPSELSLGEQRRLAFATVLACEPAAILLDEPTASLDPRARRALLDFIARSDATLIVATHDLDAALDLDARVVLLSEGRLIADGPAERLLRDEALLDSAGLALPLSIAGRPRRPR